MRNVKLYHRSASSILQRCITPVEGKALHFDIHEGVCGHHAAPQSLVGKAFQQDFYRPTAASDAKTSCTRVKAASPANACTSAGAAEHPYHVAVRGLGGSICWDPSRGPWELLIVQTRRAGVKNPEPIEELGQFP
jgi:hypothetical protein